MASGPALCVVSAAAVNCRGHFARGSRFHEILDCLASYNLITCYHMGEGEPQHHQEILALEERAKHLEQELRQCRAAINSLRAQDEKESCPSPASPYLAPWEEHSALNLKWNLGRGLEDYPPSAVYEPQEPHAPTGLHLYGLLTDDTPWQISIPFSRLACQGGCIIGRSDEEADIILPEASISRCHARLELTEQGVVVTDEHSTNGVWINNQRLSIHQHQYPLPHGSILILGNIILRAEYQ